MTEEEPKTPPSSAKQPRQRRGRSDSRKLLEDSGVAPEFILELDDVIVEKDKIVGGSFKIAELSCLPLKLFRWGLC